MKNTHTELIQNNQILRFLLDALLLIIVFRFLYVAYDGLFLLEFGDESEKYVAARMLLEGKRLYTEIFAHHGPLLYMFTHVYAGLIDSTQFNWARVMQIILASASAFSIYLSPALTNKVSRFSAVAIYIGMLSCVWVVQGLNMLLYHSVGGYLFIIALSQMIIPGLSGCHVSPIRVVISIFCMTMACFAAYVFIPSAALLFLVYLISTIQAGVNGVRQSQLWVAVFFGAMSAILIVMIWLYLYGDIKGYFVYHLYFNQKIYSSFLWWLTPTTVFHNLVLSLQPGEFVKIAINGILLCGFSSLLALRLFNGRLSLGFIIKLMIMIIGIFYLNPRGDGSFRNGALVVVAFALFAIAIAMLLDHLFTKNKIVPILFLMIPVAALMIVLEVTVRNAISSPHEMEREVYSTSYFKLATDWSDRYKMIRLIVKESEKMQVLVFGYAEYIYSDRMPATAQASYLPWAAAYKRNPIDGYKFDLCKDLRSNLPPLIIYDGWKIWEKYALPEYEPCVMEIFSEHYTQWKKNPDFYIRNDRYSELRVDQM